jgi:predicted RNA-binding Zn-ribbon protein involved in translation (DUF1610 family)
MYSFKYKWYQFNLNIACARCGNNIPMQDTKGSPECDDCGERSKQTWVDAMNFCDVKALIKGETGNKKIFGTFDANSNTEAVTSINCYECKQSIEPNEDLILTKKHTCTHCEKELHFEFFNEINNIVFYTYVNKKISDANKAALIAVRCAACGAPLETDPSKINYHCKFCGVENILPPVLRQRRVLDNVFAGVQKKAPLAKNINELNNTNSVIECLKDNKLDAFEAGALDKLIQKYPDNLLIYHIIKNDLNYDFKTETYEKLWGLTKSEPFINIIAKKLNKSESEKDLKLKKQIKTPNNQNEKDTKNAVGFFDKLKKLFG